MFLQFNNFAMLQLLFIADCRCNSKGSDTGRCNESGKCECKTNIGGFKCDRCAADQGSFPNCCHCKGITNYLLNYPVIFWIFTNQFIFENKENWGKERDAKKNIGDKSLILHLFQRKIVKIMRKNFRFENFC